VTAGGSLLASAFAGTLGTGQALAQVLPGMGAAASLDDYVGTYKLDDKLLLKVFRMDDGLFAQASGQNAFPIFPSATDAYYTKVAGISISFTRDGKGIVTGLVLHQNGDHAARKLSASESPPEPVAIALDAATLGDYVGKYKFDFGAVLDVALKSDHLEAHSSRGSPPFRSSPAPKTSSSTRSSRRNSISSTMAARRWLRSFCTRTDATCGRRAWGANVDAGSTRQGARSTPRLTPPGRRTIHARRPEWKTCKGNRRCHGSACNSRYGILAMARHGRSRLRSFRSSHARSLSTALRRRIFRRSAEPVITRLALSVLPINSWSA
jgi:hypothetical protein